jgi:hypothetical protein
MVVYLYVQNLFLCSFFLQLHVLTGLLQCENVFELIMNLFIFAPISWYNDILGCKSPLIENFNYKMFSKHPPWYVKVPQILKTIKLW